MNRFMPWCHPQLRQSGKNPDGFDFASSDKDAETRYRQWETIDPFPEISSSLLNSSEIINYVATTGMIYPFYAQRDGNDKLKPATYEVDLLGETLFWDDNGKEVIKFIHPGERFTLRKNSIAYIQLEPTFRVPYYIALRYNFQIKNVYRGLLLGTGPLVDPGFIGSLYVPIHNLTANEYEFVGGEGMIWFEFTKLNQHLDIAKSTESRGFKKHFISFPKAKLKRKTLHDYMSQASPQLPVRSTIPVEMAKSRKALRKVKTLALQFYVSLFIMSVLAYIGFFMPIHSLVEDTVNLVHSISQDDKYEQLPVEKQGKNYKIAKKDIEEIEKRYGR